MGWFSDILDTVGLGDVGSAIDTGVSAAGDFLGGGSSSGGVSASDLATDSPGDLTLGGDQFSGTDPSSVTNGAEGGSGSGFGGLAKAAGSALSATSAASNGGSNIKIQQVTPHYLQTPLDTKGATGKANRAPVADPQQIWNQWEQRLTYFVGNKK